MCYYKGRGTPRNYIEASKCFRKGLEINKDTNCQFMLALMYIKGEGVQKDHNQGMMMIRNAAKDGNEDARGYLRLVSQIDRPISEQETQETSFEDLNTPDIIAGMKGAENGRGVLSFLRKRL